VKVSKCFNPSISYNLYFWCYPN